MGLGSAVFLASFGGLLFSGGTAAQEAAPARTEQPGNRPGKSIIRVITYNVQFLPSVAGVVNARKDPVYRAKTLGTKLAAYDIVGLNEVFHDRYREILLGELKGAWGNRYNAVVSPKPEDNRFNGGLAIVSRFPFLETHVLTYSVGSSPKQYGVLADGFAAKGALHARLECGGPVSKPYVVDVFVTHLESKDAQVRQVQYAELARFIGTHGDPNYPALIMGDMNTRGNPRYMQDKGSAYHAMLSAYQQARPRTPLIDLWPHLNSGIGGTNEPESIETGNRIDYIFLSNPPKGRQFLRPISARVNPFLDSRVISLSDHSAVEAELEWKGH